MATVLVLASCSSAPAEPDAVSKLIAKRYSDCMPGLKATDIKRISDKRYSVSKDEYAVAWNVGAKNAVTGEPFTVPDEASRPQMERLGCM